MSDDRKGLARWASVAQAPGRRPQISADLFEAALERLDERCRSGEIPALVPDDFGQAFDARLRAAAEEWRRRRGITAGAVAAVGIGLGDQVAGSDAVRTRHDRPEDTTAGPPSLPAELASAARTAATRASHQARELWHGMLASLVPIPMAADANSFLSDNITYFGFGAPLANLCGSALLEPDLAWARGASVELLCARTIDGRIGAVQALVEPVSPASGGGGLTIELIDPAGKSALLVLGPDLPCETADTDLSGDAGNLRITIFADARTP